MGKTAPNFNPTPTPSVSESLKTEPQPPAGKSQAFQKIWVHSLVAFSTCIFQLSISTAFTTVSTNRYGCILWWLCYRRSCSSSCSKPVWPASTDWSRTTSTGISSWHFWAVETVWSWFTWKWFWFYQ